MPDRRNPEYSVHDEPDFARVYDEDEMITIRRGDLRALLDLATGSMDFGSGFWDNEQVEVAHAAAAILGIDPKLVTPANFHCRYFGHTWRWRPRMDYGNFAQVGPKQFVWSYWCEFCNKQSDSTREVISPPNDQYKPALHPPAPPAPDPREGL